MEVNKIHLSTVDSTNTWARNRLKDLPQDQISRITAEQQTAGRGRQKKRWLSPKGENLYATFLFFLSRPSEAAAAIPQVTALAVSHVLNQYGFNPLLKWPNDILLNGKKIGGILTETTPWKGGAAVIVGVGLNINLRKEELAGIDQPATSMMIESGNSYSVPEVCESLTKEWASGLSLLLTEGFSPFYLSYKEKLTLKEGDQLKVGEEEAILESLNSDGSLNVLTASGSRKRVI